MSSFRNYWPRQWRRIASLVILAAVSAGCGNAENVADPGSLATASSIATETAGGQVVAPTLPTSTTVTDPTTTDRDTTSTVAAVGTVVRGVFVDPRIIAYLNDISLPRDAAETFGGVVDDAANGRAIVYFSSELDVATADSALRRAIDQANAWINRSVVDESGNPVISPVAPATPVELVASDLTYADFAVVTRQVVDKYLNVGRLVSTVPNFAMRRVDVELVDLTLADVNAAQETFGGLVFLIDSKPN